MILSALFAQYQRMLFFPKAQRVIQHPCSSILLFKNFCCDEILMSNLNPLCYLFVQLKFAGIVCRIRYFHQFHIEFKSWFKYPNICSYGPAQWSLETVSLTTMWPWPTHLISLSLDFLTCKIKVQIHNLFFIFLRIPRGNVKLSSIKERLNHIHDTQVTRALRVL